MAVEAETVGPVSRWWLEMRRLLEERSIPVVRGDVQQELGTAVHLEVEDAFEAFPIMLDALVPTLCLWAGDDDESESCRIGLLVGSTWQIVTCEAVDDDVEDLEDDEGEDGVLVVPPRLVELVDLAVRELAERTALDSVHDEAHLERSVMRTLAKAVKKEPEEIRSEYARHGWRLSRMANRRAGAEVLERHLALVRENASTYAREVLDRAPDLRDATKDQRRRAIQRYLRKVDEECPVTDLAGPVLSALNRLIDESMKGVPLIP